MKTFYTLTINEDERAVIACALRRLVVVTWGQRHAPVGEVREMTRAVLRDSLRALRTVRRATATPVSTRRARRSNSLSLN